MGCLRVALDASLLAYAQGPNGVARQAEARTVISGLSETETGLAVQVLSERVAWWDAIVMASALNAECELPLSEDFQDGFVRPGLRVRNPFTTTPR